MAGRSARGVVAVLGLAVLLAAGLDPAVAAVDGRLTHFVARPDPALAWDTRQAGRVRGARFRELILTSQVWQGEPWRHQLFVVCPGNARPDRPALLVIGGGDWRDSYLGPPPGGGAPAGTGRYRDLARRIGAPVAVVLQVPAQPLLGGLREDALVAASFARYLDGAGPDWPLLLPMAKAGSAALTALAAVAATDCGVTPSRFIVTGASKRGWATWLLAAADPRVAAIAPTVFDAVRLDAQMQHQRYAWGGLSPLLEPYAPLLDRLGTPAGQDLLALVDPWRHRDRLGIPKLIVLAGNDPYFPPDSASLYYGGMAPASLLYLPNEGHVPADLRPLAAGLGALADAVAAGRALPALTLAATAGGDRVALELAVDARPRVARLWVARAQGWAPRFEPYVAVPVAPDPAGTYRTALPLDGGFVAVFGEGEFGRGRRRYRLSSPLVIIGPGGVRTAGFVPTAPGSGG